MLAVLLAGYLGQRYLPPPTPKIIGIDLGKPSMFYYHDFISPLFEVTLT